MDDRSWDIDRIVREVLRRLGEGPRPAHGEAEAPPQASPPRDNGRSELRLDERVVTLEAVDGRLDGVRRVLLRHDAIITPAVKDELRKRSVAVAQDDRRPSGGSAPTTLVFALAETNYDATALVAQVGGSSVPAETLPAAVERLVERVCGQGQPGVLLTEQIAPALCLANRHQGVRAALGGSVPMVRDALHSVGANLLVINPAGRSLAELTNVTREFIRGTPRDCPVEYRSML